MAAFLFFNKNFFGCCEGKAFQLSCSFKEMREGKKKIGSYVSIEKQIDDDT